MSQIFRKNVPNELLFKLLDNNAVKTHSTISDLLMKTAITPAHSEPDMTFVYEHKIDQDEIKNVFGSKKQPKQYSFLLDQRSRFLIIMVGDGFDKRKKI